MKQDISNYAIRAREKVEQEFALEIPAARYASLFDEILEKRDRRAHNS